MECSKFIVSIDRQTWRICPCFLPLQTAVLYSLTASAALNLPPRRFLLLLNTSAHPRPLHNHIAHTSL